MEPLVDKKSLDSSPGPLDCTSPSRPCRAAMYKAVLARALSIVQLVCGILVASSSFVMIITMGFDLKLNGLHLGSTFIMAGLLGMAASKYKSYSLIIPSMVMSILATIAAIPMALALLFASAAFGIADSREMPLGISNGFAAFLLLLSAVLFIAESTAAIWVSVLSGNIVCPCRGTDRGGEGKVYTNYASGHSLPYGIVQIVVAALVFVLGIAALVMNPRTPQSSVQAIYIIASIFYLPAGILGVVAAYRRTLPVIVSHMILCIFAAVMAGLHLLIALAMVFSGNNGGSEAEYYPYKTQSRNGASTIVNVLLLICGVLEFVIAIMSSVLCCRVTCCAPSQGPPRVFADYKTGQSRAIGAIQIVFGILTVTFEMGYVFAGRPWIYTFAPLPSGILTIITGSFGIKAAKTKARSKIITHWILSLMTLLYAISMIGYSLQILTVAARDERYFDETVFPGEHPPLARVPDQEPFFHPFHGISISLAAVEIALALWAAAISYLASRADIYSHQAEVSAHGPTTTYMYGSL